MQTDPATTKREILNIRISPDPHGQVDRVAKVSGKTRTDFVLDAARLAAEDALRDRTLLALDPEAYAEFVARLDAPANPSERLRRAMQTLAPWEK